MAIPHAPSPRGHAITWKLDRDPWSLTLAERADIARALAPSQTRWLERLRTLRPQLTIDDDFPAFLLEHAPWAALRASLARARHPDDLDWAVRSDLDEFVRGFRRYMRFSDEHLARERSAVELATARDFPNQLHRERATLAACR